jgi:hypothetical protein
LSLLKYISVVSFTGYRQVFSLYYFSKPSPLYLALLF